MADNRNEAAEKFKALFASFSLEKNLYTKSSAVREQVLWRLTDNEAAEKFKALFASFSLEKKPVHENHRGP